MKPATWGSTARLAAMSLAAVLLALGASLGMVAWLVTHASTEALAASMGAVQAIASSGLLALGGAGAVGAGIHGARHLGGPPAPTSAELQRTGPALRPAEEEP